MLFMVSKIQTLNGTHNLSTNEDLSIGVVHGVKDTKSDYRVQNTELYHTLK